MDNSVNVIASAAFACGFAVLVSAPAAALPVARVGVDATPATEPVHAVRVCGPRGCFLTTAGHRHGWRRYGWRPHRHWGWRGHHWR
ncbi:hypothetical protein [Methylocystis echinoides]|jgi:hypothetical protein|uniref:hypothetical protein n=1 Tax=Methylocystis echinoides TaxID=29468 RepID=UPI00342C9263